MRWWTRTHSALSALALSFAGCGTPVSPPARGASCVETRARVEARRRDLAAGRLLRVAPAEAQPADASCPAEAAALAALEREAATSLGDAEAVARLGGAAPPSALFAPDGPVAAFDSAEKTSAGYGRAVAEYLAGRWASAGKLGLSVGASGGPLATEGLILAARSAEREGDAARAARMWARAYRVGCARGCAVQPPREDLFARAAQLGKLVPEPDVSHCWAPGEGLDVVHGDWYLTPAPGGQDLREIPSRVLLEHVEAPPGSQRVCYSPNGRHRIAVLTEPDGRWSCVFGAMGAAWGAERERTSRPPEARETHVTDDGQLVVVDRTGFEVVGPSRKAPLEVSWPKDLEPGNASPGDGLFFVELHTRYSETSPSGTVTVPMRREVARYDLDTGKRSPLLPGEDGLLLAGPVEGGNRVVLRRAGKLVWVDGATGKKLSEVEAPDDLDTVLSRVGPSSVLRDDRTLDLATGKVAAVALTWRPDPRLEHDPDGLQSVARALPLGASRGTLGERQGWTASLVRGGTPDGPAGVPVTILEIARGGGENLRGYLTADARGAMIVDAAGRFELIGQVPAAFVASASCGARGAPALPAPGDRAWPLEVCGAAREEPGLTEAWLRGGGRAP